LVVGTGVNTKLVPKSCKEGWLRVYAMKDEGRVLEFMHKVSWTIRWKDRELTR
jgi:splicing factor 3B subunit 3